MNREIKGRKRKIGENVAESDEEEKYIQFSRQVTNSSLKHTSSYETGHIQASYSKQKPKKKKNKNETNVFNVCQTQNSAEEIKKSKERNEMKTTERNEIEETPNNAERNETEQISVVDSSSSHNTNSSKTLSGKYSHNEEPKLGVLINNEFILQEFIERGGYGSVYKGYDCLKKEEVAIKVVKKGGEREKYIMNQLKSYTDVPDTILIAHTVFKYKNLMCLVMPLLKFDLTVPMKHLKSVYSTKNVVQVIYQCAVALKFLHTKCFIHRDIKTMNIMISKDSGEAEIGSDGLIRLNPLVIKVADFGLAIKQDERMLNIAGTRPFFAPELLYGSEYDEKIDVFSLGHTALHMLTGSYIFFSVSINMQKILIKNFYKNIITMIDNNSYCHQTELLKLRESTYPTFVKFNGDLLYAKLMKIVGGMVNPSAKERLNSTQILDMLK